MSAAEAISTPDFLDGMRQFASSVCVVTTADEDSLHGVTVTSLVSVSVEPPTLLVCIHHESHCAAAIQHAGVFCVNLLSEDAKATAQLFAGASAAARHLRFDHVNWMQGRGGCPILADAVTAFECKVMETMQVATHYIFLATVIGSKVGQGAAPLLYSDRAFRRLAAAKHQA